MPKNVVSENYKAALGWQSFLISSSIVMGRRDYLCHALGNVGPWSTGSALGSRRSLCRRENFPFCTNQSTTRMWLVIVTQGYEFMAGGWFCSESCARKPALEYGATLSFSVPCARAAVPTCSTWFLRVLECA